MKIVNKKTGEVIDLSNATSDESDSSLKSKSVVTDKKIEERGKIQGSVKKVASGGVAQKVIGGLELASAPLSAIESGIANPMLQLQKGNVNPANLVKESILGFTLQKQGQYGDVMKNAGYNPLLADSAGLLLNLSPVKVYMGVAKTFGNISKMSDKGLLKAGNNLIYAVDEAKAAAGKTVGDAYAKGADNLGVDGLEFLNGISDIPKPVLNKIETKFGKLEDFAKGLTIGAVRELKTYIGKLKPNSFGKAEHGIQETLDIQDLNKGYGNLKELMKDTMTKAKMDKKEIEHLLNLDESFGKVMEARRFIKKSIVDPTINLPTRVGSFAEQVSKSADQTSRIALSEIKRASAKARNLINKSMGEIESFERWQQAKQIGAHAVRAAAFGGIAGGIGGRILQKAQGDTN